MTTEAPLTTTIKASGPSAPWVVIRSENTVQLSQQLAELQANTTFADLARANEAFQAHFSVGSILGARGVDAPKDTGAFAPQQISAPAAEPTQQELFAQFMAAQNPAGLPTAQPLASGPTAPNAYPPAGNTYQQPASPGTPGAPLVAGMAAKLVEGTSAKGKWQAWADPRPKDLTDHMQKTDDVNHPGLLSGTHKLWKFIR
ncbi:MAG TPA: hypothetical protein VLJ40_11215 [Arthrobacter sp.]|nr:hypothetical protein [Arthrobacter sp.]